MSADGGDDFVRRRVFFHIKDYIDVLQILRRKITGKFLIKDVCDCRILYILKDSSVRGKYGRRVLLIAIAAFGQRGAYEGIELVVKFCHTYPAIESFAFLL